MIRRMKHGEEDKVRVLIAKLSFEDQIYWRKQTKSLEDYVGESSRIPVSDEIKGKNVIFVAEEDGTLVGLCWCSIVDRGVDKQGELVEFYVEREYRGKGIGMELITAAKQLFVKEQVGAAFAWIHRSNGAAIRLFKNAGLKEVDQIVMAFVPAHKNET